jgi:hypothetical protein
VLSFLARQNGELMDIEKFVFASATLGIGFAVISYLRGAVAKLAIVALALGVMLLGPQVFGPDWYFDGFIAGAFMGDFFGTVATKGDESEEESEDE